MTGAITNYDEIFECINDHNHFESAEAGASNFVSCSNNAEEDFFYSNFLNVPPSAQPTVGESNADVQQVEDAVVQREKEVTTNRR